MNAALKSRSVKERVSHEEWALRVELAAAYHLGPRDDHARPRAIALRGHGCLGRAVAPADLDVGPVGASMAGSRWRGTIGVPLGPAIRTIMLRLWISMSCLRTVCSCPVRLSY